MFVSACLLAAGAIGPGSIATAAQPAPQAPRFPMPDPIEILDRLFGADTEADRKALESVQVSPEEERRLGKAALDGFLAEMRRRKIAVVSRGKDVQYLRALVATLQPKMAQADRYRTIEVYVVQSPLIEARSAPGGCLVFFRGLLESAGSEAAVASVVAHELSHLDRGHQLLRAKAMKLAQQSLEQGVPAPSRRAATNGDPAVRASRPAIKNPLSPMTLVRLWARPFRPEDEMAADADAVRWTHEAGYDPREMLDVLEAIGRQRKAPPIPLPDFLCSHPAPDARGKAVMALYAELTQGRDEEELYLGKENLRRRIPRSRHEFPE